MSGPILERAKTGRSTCRSSGMAIDEGSWRVGIEAYRAGRMTMTWIKPRCFLDDLVVEYSSNGRAHCKATGDLIQKGECRVAFSSGPSKSWYRPSAAAPFIADCFRTCFGGGSKRGGEEGAYDLSSITGLDDLEEEHRSTLLAMFKGGKKLKDPVRTPSVAASERSKKRKKSQTSKRKPTTKKEKMDEDGDSEELMSDQEEEEEEGDESEEDDEEKELVWAKFSNNPWWPGYMATLESITEEHIREKPSVPKNTKLVIFYGPRPSWAWVSSGPGNLCPFEDGHHSLKCKTHAFRTALKQADAQAAKQKVAEGITQKVKNEGTPEPEPVSWSRSSATATPSSSQSVKDGERGGEPEVMEVESTVVKMNDGLSEYERARLSNIARNEEFMASLGLSSTRAAMRNEAFGSTASQRGLGVSTRHKRAKRANVTPREPTRRSSRNQGIKADGVYIAREDRGGHVTLAGADAAAVPNLHAKIAEDKSERRRRRREKDSMSLLECAEGYESPETDDGDDDDDDDDDEVKAMKANTTRTTSGFVSSLQRLSAEAAAAGTEPPLAKDEAAYAQRIGKLRIGEEEVAKVVPDRIYSVAVLPSASSIVAAVGDRSGNLGIWNYSDQSKLADNGVLAFNPHTATINVLEFDPTSPSRLFSTAYDGTIRCFDIETSRFDLVYASEVHGRDYWLQHSCLARDGKTMILGDSDGNVCLLDMRAKNARSGTGVSGSAKQNKGSTNRVGGAPFPSGGFGVTWEARCHPKKVQTVSLNPANPNYLATATLDRAVKIYDLRRLPTSAGAAGCGGATFDAPEFPAVCGFTENYSVNCAYWNPSGDRVVSVVMGPDGGSKGNLRLFHNPHLMGCSADGATPKAKASACLYGAVEGAAASLDHDNKTGRYLPVFHASWDPKFHNAFICGSMTQPRIVEVFSTAALHGDGGINCLKQKKDKKSMALGCKRVGVLGDGGDFLASVQSRSAFHPFLDVVVCGNASGRVHIFK